MASTCRLDVVSRAPLYRALRGERRPRDPHRADRGQARVMNDGEIERWCEIVAAMKKSTTNRKGRHLSTARALKLVKEHEGHKPEVRRKLSPGLLTISMLNRHMRRLGYDHARMTRAPATVRSQAEHDNDRWHFDLSPPALKQLAASPPWVDLERGGTPTLMLFSVVDDRSGLAYLEYTCVYGEDVEAAFGFLFRAMSAKLYGTTNPLQGIPRQFHLDNGPIARSVVCKRVMESLDVIVTLAPAGRIGRGNGWIGVTALTPMQWAALSEMIGRPELANDPRFTTTLDRLRHAEAVDAVLAPFVAARPGVTAEEGRARRIPMTPVGDPAELPKTQRV